MMLGVLTALQRLYSRFRQLQMPLPARLNYRKEGASIAVEQINGFRFTRDDAENGNSPIFAHSGYTAPNT